MIREASVAQFNVLRTSRTVALGSVVVLCTLGSVLLTWTASVGAAPTVTFSPAASASRLGLLEFADGDRVNVNLSAGLFQGNVLVKAIECSDPGGSDANLPKSNETCDGNTIATAVTARSGALSLSFEFFSLPNRALGEKPPGLATCDLTNVCVLYVGVNQEDFTQTKVFSPPFYMNTVGSVYASAETHPSANASAPSPQSAQSSNATGSESTSAGQVHSTNTTKTNTTSTTSSPSTSTPKAQSTPSAAPSATASDHPDGSLAFTGTSPALLGAAGFGAACALGAGVLGRRIRRIDERYAVGSLPASSTSSRGSR